MSAKFKFMTESKHVESKPLNKIIIISSQKALSISDVTNDSRSDKIQGYYQNLQKIKDSRKGSGVSIRYDLPEIREIYKLIKGLTKPPTGNKGDLINEIVKFYEEDYQSIIPNVRQDVILVLNPQEDVEEDDIDYFG